MPDLSARTVFSMHIHRDVYRKSYFFMHVSILTDPAMGGENE